MNTNNNSRNKNVFHNSAMHNGVKNYIRFDSCSFVSIRGSKFPKDKI